MYIIVCTYFILALKSENPENWHNGNEPDQNNPTQNSFFIDIIAYDGFIVFCQ